MLSSAANWKFKIFKAFLNALWNLPWTLGYTQLEMIHLVTLGYKQCGIFKCGIYKQCALLFNIY